MKKRYLLIGALFLFACNGRLDEMRPHNMAEADSYLGSFNNIVNATSGLYGQFLMQAGGYSEAHHYHGSYHVLGEFRGNNVIFAEAFPAQSGFMTSPDYLRAPDAHFFLNSDQKSQSYAWALWAKSQQLILGASRNIIAIDKLYGETVNPDEKRDLIRLKGENAFLRGLMIFNATNVFGRPFWDNPDVNLGIPLDVEATAEMLPRNTVRECFEQAVADFRLAASCLPDERSDRTFANKVASFGMLSRVYLYMGGLPESPDEEYNRLAVAYADSTFSLVNDVVEVLRGEELKDLYDNPKTNKEILFAFFTGNFPSGVGNAVHNYYSWSGYESEASTSVYCCEISHDYEKIMDKENDLRWQYFTEPSVRHAGRFSTTKYNGGADNIFADYYSFICPSVFIRAGEVVLNRAEAYAKLGEDTKALRDLNEIRDRAGLEELSGLSGDNLFEEIFTERRRELAFEALTYYDYVRNGVTMKREEVSVSYSNYTGAQYNEIDPKSSRRTVCLIPAEELLLNDKLVQNDY